MDVVLRIAPADIELANAVLAEAQLEPQPIKTAGIDGGNDLLSIIVTITSHSLTALVAILGSKWRRNKDVVIEVKGMKVKGADPEQIEGILQQMLDALPANKKQE